MCVQPARRCARFSPKAKNPRASLAAPRSGEGAPPTVGLNTSGKSRQKWADLDSSRKMPQKRDLARRKGRERGQAGFGEDLGKGLFTVVRIWLNFRIRFLWKLALCGRLPWRLHPAASQRRKLCLRVFRRGEKRVQPPTRTAQGAGKREESCAR